VIDDLFLVIEEKSPDFLGNIVTIFEETAKEKGTIFHFTPRLLHDDQHTFSFDTQTENNFKNPS